MDCGSKQDAQVSLPFPLGGCRKSSGTGMHFLSVYEASKPSDGMTLTPQPLQPLSPKNQNQFLDLSIAG